MSQNPGYAAPAHAPAGQQAGYGHGQVGGPGQGGPFAAPAPNPQWAPGTPSWQAPSDAKKVSGTTRFAGVLLVLAGALAIAGGLMAWADIEGYGARGGSTLHQIIAAGGGALVVLAGLLMLGFGSKLLPVLALLGLGAAGGVVVYNMLEINKHLAGYASYGIGIWLTFGAVALGVMGILAGLMAKRPAPAQIHRY